jgi:hypothetical protein
MTDAIASFIFYSLTAIALFVLAILLAQENSGSGYVLSTSMHYGERK